MHPADPALQQRAMEEFLRNHPEMLQHTQQSVPVKPRVTIPANIDYYTKMTQERPHVEQASMMTTATLPTPHQPVTPQMQLVNMPEDLAEHLVNIVQAETFELVTPETIMIQCVLRRLIALESKIDSFISLQKIMQQPSTHEVVHEQNFKPIQLKFGAGEDDGNEEEARPTKRVPKSRSRTSKTRKNASKQ